MASIDPAWVQGIAGVIQALGIIFALDQVRLLRRQIATDHELARRSRAIDDVRAYVNALDRAHPAARRLVDDFNEDQIDLLVKRVPFVLGDGSRKIVDSRLLVRKESGWKGPRPFLQSAERVLSDERRFCYSK